MEFFACYKQATPLGFLLATLEDAKHLPEGETAGARGPIFFRLCPFIWQAESRFRDESLIFARCVEEFRDSSRRLLHL